jgi:hypothetical protein
MIQVWGGWAAPEEDEMEILMNLALAQKAALRKAAEKGGLQAVVAAYGGYAVPSADEMEYELAGAPVIAVYNPAGKLAGLMV